MRDSGLPADALVGKLTKDNSFALRRGTIAQENTALDAAQGAVEDELALSVALLYSGAASDRAPSWAM
jgi:hypothetical protein